MNGREAMEVLAERAEYLSAMLARWPDHRNRRWLKRERKALRIAVAALAADEYLSTSQRVAVWSDAAAKVAANARSHDERAASGGTSTLHVDVPVALLDRLVERASAADVTVGVLVAGILADAVAGDVEAAA